MKIIIFIMIIAGSLVMITNIIRYIAFLRSTQDVYLQGAVGTG